MAQHYDWGPHDDGQRWVIASTTDSAAVHNSSTANRGCTLQTTASNNLTMAKDTKIARRANSTANALTTAARTFPTDGQLGQYIADNVHRLPLPMTPNSAGAPTSPTTSSLSPCAPHSRPTGAQRCRQRPVLARPWPRGSKSAGVITPRPTRSPRRAHVAISEEGLNVAKTAAFHAVLCCGVAACPPTTPPRASCSSERLAGTTRSGPTALSPRNRGHCRHQHQQRNCAHLDDGEQVPHVVNDGQRLLAHDRG